MSIRLLVGSADDLRDSLPTSGVFDMTDCIVTIDCPLECDVEEVRKMVTILESAIHVFDIDIVSYVAPRNEYEVLITEVPLDTIEQKKARFKKQLTAEN